MTDYVYVLQELGEEHTGFVKIGHSIHPLDRPDGYQAGNWRELIVVFILIGGQPLETEISRRFSEDKIGDGGDEWYKVTPELLNFLHEKLFEALTIKPRFSSEIEFGNGPSHLPIVELAEPKTRSVPPIKSVGSIQPHDIKAASPPKNPYARVQKR
jgi:hypothetical protein